MMMPRSTIVTAFLIVGGLLVSHLLAENQNRRILVLHSYHQGLEWTDSITDGIKDVFEDDRDSISIDFDYLDTKRNTSALYFLKLQQLYNKKSRLISYDAVILSDNNAFNFYIENRKLFTGSPPAFFCGVNNYDPSMIEGVPNITGVVEATDFEGNIELMLRLHPETERIVFINDQTVTGRANKEQLLRIIPKYEHLVRFEFLEEFELENIADDLQPLGESDLIYLLTFNRDINGKFVSYKYGAVMIRQSTDVPVYGSWDFYLAKGIVGGKIISGYRQGVTAAEMAKKVLNGESIKSIPVLEDCPSDYMFDFEETERINIDYKLLPKNSVFINKPNTYSKKSFVFGYGVIFILLVFSIHQAVRHRKVKLHRIRIEKEKKKLDKVVKKRTKKLSEANKRLELEIDERKIIEEKLRESNATKDKFFSIIAHDLKNPFFGLINLTELLEKDWKEFDEAELESILKELSNQSKSTYQLLQNLLNWANLKQNKIRSNPEVLKIADLIDEGISLIQSNVTSKNITITNEVDHEIHTSVDRFMLTTVINNLLGNAVKFTPEGGRIKVGLSKVSDELISLCVEDSGIGLTDKQLCTIFQSDVVDSRKGTNNEVGTGLGLVICKEFVHRMNGDIQVTSEGEGLGTAFTVRLPA